ncbi:MAG TPA: TonB-dependent receptor [Gemmatirosa sp.]
MTVLARSVAFAALTLLASSAGAAVPGVVRAATRSAAQRGELRGRVVNAAGQAPIGTATVVVVPVGSTVAAGRTATNADGVFRLAGLRPGRYRVRVRAIGYTPRELPMLDIGAATSNVDLGTVALTAAALELQAVAVTGQQQAVQLAPDRNTYVVRDMPVTRGGSALDVLRNVPGVDVDLDNLVSLRGNAGVVVQINGRPSPLTAAQLGDFLAQLPADMVERVEVIPNPSARDDPTGVAGIINVVLKQRVDAGRSGGITLSGGTTGSAQVGANLGVQRGPLSLYGSYGFFRDNRPRTDAIRRTDLTAEPVTYLDESATRTQTQQGHTFTGNAGYQLGARDALSLEGLFTTRSEAESYGILYRDLNAAQTLTGLSNRLTQSTNHRYNLGATLSHKHEFADKGHTLASELHAFRAQESGPSRIAAQALALDGTPAGASDFENQATLEHPDETWLKVDYAQPVSKLLRFETGYKGSVQRFHTTLDTQVLDTLVGAYGPDSTRISNFTYDEVVHAAYGMLDAHRGRFLLQGGVRVEHATTQFHLRTRNATYDNAYTSVFPSALVAYNVDDADQVKLSYSTRIRRPDDTDLLDPTPQYLDPLNVSRGNPFLKPEYIRAFELGLQRTANGATFQVTPFFRHTLDAIRTIRTLDSAGVATRTFANVATSDAYGTDVTVAARGGRLSGFAGASAFRQVSDAANLDPSLSARTFGWTARTNATFRASGTLDLQTLVSYQAPMTVEQGRISSRTRVSFAARQKLTRDQTSLTLRVVDPFNTSRETTTTIDPRFTQVSDRRRAIRGLVLSINRTFGGAPKAERREPNEQGSDPGAS